MGEHRTRKNHRLGDGEVDMADPMGERPPVVKSETVHLPIHGHTFITTGGEDPHRSREVFIKGDGYVPCMRAALEGMARVINLALEEGVSQEKIEKSLMGIVCCPVWVQGGTKVNSIPDAIAQELRRHRRSAPGALS